MRLRYAGQVAKMGVMGKAYKIFVGKTFRETLGTQRRMDNIQGGWKFDVVVHNCVQWRAFE